MNKTEVLKKYNEPSAMISLDAKRNESQRISAEIAEFISKGGKIDHIPRGMVSETYGMREYDERRKKVNKERIKAKLDKEARQSIQSVYQE